MTIENIELSDLPGIIAGLVREGIGFKAYPKGGLWRVEMTGGF